jgi:hypothetical protein
MKKSTYIFAAVLMSNCLFGQEHLTVNTAFTCLYQGDSIPNELYRYPIESDTIELIKNTILYKTNIPDSLELSWSNVPSIATIEDKGKYYILYSRRKMLPLLRQAENKILVCAMLAHAIGHYANAHRLIPVTHEEDETEADEYMGYALALMGFAQEEVEQIPGRLIQTHGLDSTDRSAAILRGYLKADAGLQNGVHAAYYEQNINSIIQNFPQFQLPPPQWSADANLSDYFDRCKTLYDAEKILRTAMNATGYYSRRYFRVVNGFAMVTQLEQINADGSCKPEEDRWKSKPVRSSQFSIIDYMYALFVPQPGHFRIVAFVVTPEPFSNNSTQKISREEATGWLNEGRNCLPDYIGNQAFIPEKTVVTALFYEFICKESDQKLNLVAPGSLGAMRHLQMSGLLNYFPRP